LENSADLPDNNRVLEEIKKKNPRGLLRKDSDYLTDY